MTQVQLFIIIGYLIFLFLLGSFNVYLFNNVKNLLFIRASTIRVSKLYFVASFLGSLLSLSGIVFVAWGN